VTLCAQSVNAPYESNFDQLVMNWDRLSASPNDANVADAIPFDGLCELLRVGSCVAHACRAKAPVNFSDSEVLAEVRRERDAKVQDARTGAVYMRW
jgi:hypothetical protein